MTAHPAQPLTSHLEELRNRLIKASIAVVAGAIVAFVFRHWIFDLIVAPYEDIAAGNDLVFFRPTEAFSLFMRLSLFGGFVIASPVVIWQVWAFIAPALTKREKRVVVPIVMVLVILFLAGLAVGYWSLGRGLEFLIDFGGDDLDPVIGGNDYLSFAMRFLLVFGLSFEFPVFLYAAAAVGAVTWRRLASGRRWAVLLIVTVGAVITPSGDPLTLLLLSIPLYLLYEATIWIVRFTLRR
ncbi:MAG TPA: twin-arginine translocase subunit TatC [Acidimicrobiia bacterium]|nr:twin-arginine translocase subunit TatC [Acidimicrobiia bacterium]